MMPTENRVPATFTINIDGTQLELSTNGAAIDLFPRNRDEFVTAIRGINIIPGATQPKTSLGVGVHIDAGGIRFLVVAPADLRPVASPPQASPALQSAIADAVNVTKAAE